MQNNFHTYFPTAHLTGSLRSHQTALNSSPVTVAQIKEKKKNLTYNELRICERSPNPYFQRPVSFLPLRFSFLCVLRLQAGSPRLRAWNTKLGQDWSADFYKEPEAAAHTSIILCCTQREALGFNLPPEGPQTFSKKPMPTHLNISRHFPWT